jgi:hypothetical protein
MYIYFKGKIIISKKYKKLFKNLLTNAKHCGIIYKLPRKKRKRKEYRPTKSKGIKKFRKFFKNLLTKRFEGDIIYKLSQRVEANRNLTTEQQIKEVQSKLKQVRIQNLSKPREKYYS